MVSVTRLLIFYRVTSWPLFPMYNDNIKTFTHSIYRCFILIFNVGNKLFVDRGINSALRSVEKMSVTENQF